MMKFRKMMFAGLALSMLSACNQDDLSGNDVNGAGEGDAYMSLSIAMPSASGSSRAIAGGETDAGDDVEQQVSDLVIYVWSKNGTLTAAETFRGDQLSPTKPSPAPHPGDKSTVYTTPAFKVASGESKVVAIVNGNTTINGEILFDKETMGNIGNTESTYKTLRKVKNFGDIAKDCVAKISDDNKFLMTNAFNIRNIGADGNDLSQVDKADANDYNFNLDGTVGVNIIGTKQNPTTVIIPVERVVAKLEVKGSFERNVVKVDATGKPTDVETGDVVKFTGVALINGNKSFYPIKQVRANGTDDTNDFIVDTNFDNNPQVDKTTTLDNVKKFITDNFYDTDFKGNVGIEWKDLTKAETKQYFYTLENTMTTKQQMNGFTTGLYYKAEYRLNKHKDDPTASDVYRYQGGLYDWDDVQKVKGFPTGKIKIDSSIDLCAEYGITKYEVGVCYYPYWIRHINNSNPSVMGDMEFGVVRNNWYQMELGKVTGIGTNTPVDPDPNTPDETAEAQLQVVVKVLPWTVRNNTVDF